MRHRWDLTIPEARALQEELRGRVSERDAAVLRRPRTIAGVDVSFDKRDPLLHAGVVVLDAQSLETVEEVAVSREVHFPYVPGYLSLREIPPLLEAFEALRSVPDLILCDGHGRAHPRRFGLACHLGLVLGLPSFGCAKSRLVGEHREPGPRRGASVQLTHEGERIGRVLRTREGVKPIYVSIGHRITLETACRLALRCAPRFRLPEPTRRAHQLVNAQRRGR